MYELVILVGRLTADPEMRYTPGGDAVTNFNLAVDADYTDAQGTKIERTKFFKITCWKKVAEIVNQYKHKGDPVMVEGEMQMKFVKNADGKMVGNGPDIWNRQDGSPAANYEIRAQRVVFLPSPKAGVNAAGAGGTPAASSSATDPTGDGIPF
jgi:single-strand DNA-binding protein